MDDAKFECWFDNFIKLIKLLRGNVFHIISFKVNESLTVI